MPVLPARQRPQPRHSATAAALVVTALLAGVACAPARQATAPAAPAVPSAAAPQSTSGPAVGPLPALAPGEVGVWVTTPDRSKLLERQPNVTLGSLESARGPTLVVDTSTTYQEIVGFGAALTESSAWLIQNRMSPAQRDSLLRELFSRREGLGLSFTRLAMGASDFALDHWSYDDVPAGQSDPTLARFSIERDRRAVLPVLKQALAINPQLKVMASPWSAPAWMKTTGSMIKGTLKPEAYGPFALYFRKFIEAYAAEGVPIFAITVQNEPHFEPGDYPGMRLEPPQRAAFLKNHLGPLFARSRIRTLILDWDHNWDEYDSPLAVLADSAAKKFVGGVAWHCYAGEVSAQSLVKYVHPDVDAYFTECSGGTWSPEFAQSLKWFAGTLVMGTTRHWARGVLLWNLALDEKNGPHAGGCPTCRGVVTIDSATGRVTRNVEYYALGHASRFVRPGARRIASSSDFPLSVETVAFRNGDDRSMTVLVLNGAAHTQSFTVRVGERGFTYQLPAGAVATFHWR